jgi:hypothetical protein
MGEKKPSSASRQAAVIATRFCLQVVSPPSSKEKQKRGKKEEPVLESLGSDILKRNASTDLAFSRQF